jgi:hypothetical protein
MTSAVRARFGLLAIAAAGLATGCSSRALGPDAGGAGGTDGTPFTPTRDVDMLFVIKNSASTSLIQRNLLDNFPTFTTTLQSAPAGLPNLHIAVISTDMGAGDGSISGCSATGGDAGKFYYAPRGTCTQSNLEPGATFISNVNGVANYTGDLADVFTCIAQVGNSGCGFEQPLGAVSRALGADGQPPPVENQGFLRPDAFLFIFVLMNEDDCSAPPGGGPFDVSSGTTLDSPLGPLNNYRCNEFGHLCNGAKPPRHAPTGSATDTVTLDNCLSAEAAGMLTPVATLVAQLRSLKHHPDQQILVGAVVGPTTPYTVYWHTPNPADSGPWPEITHTCTALDQTVADPAVRINHWAQSFGANGQILSICDTSYAPLLQTLADKINQQLPPPMNQP